MLRLRYVLPFSPNIRHAFYYFFIPETSVSPLQNFCRPLKNHTMSHIGRAPYIRGNTAVFDLFAQSSYI